MNNQVTIRKTILDIDISHEKDYKYISNKFSRLINNNEKFSRLLENKFLH